MLITGRLVSDAVSDTVVVAGKNSGICLTVSNDGNTEIWPY
jgi:hypothetical protein